MGAPIVKCAYIIAVINMYLIAVSRSFIYKSSRLNRLQLECLDTSKANAIDVLMLRAGLWSTGDRDIKLQKWALCVLEGDGLMTPEGIFLLDKALARVPEHKQEKIIDRIDACLFKTKHYPHEAAWHYLKCQNKKHNSELKLM